MFLRFVVNPLGRIGNEKELPRGYVFIDLNSRACRAVEDDNPLCDSRSPATPKLASRVSRAVLDANPDLVIIDVRLWGDPAARKDLVSLAAAIRDHGNPPVLAVAPFRPSKRKGEGVIEPRLIPQELSGGEVKFAPAFVWGENPKLRSSPRQILVETPDHVTGLTPTLPELAARYSKTSGVVTNSAAATCPRSSNPVVCWTTVPNPELISGGSEETALFSLPSLVPPDGQIRAGDAAQFQGFYERFAASDAVTPAGELKISRALFAGKVVLVGSSAAIAQDMHATPLGEMAGGEVILNMVRAFSAEATFVEPSLMPKLIREATYCLVGSLPFAFYWFTSAKLTAWVAGRPWLRFFRFLALSPLFLCAIAASAALMVGLSFYTVGGISGGHRGLDLYAPLVALSLEGITDVAARLLERFEFSAKWLREASYRLMARAKGLTSDKG